ncbi:hypothetical protein [Nonomuraea sp. NPDC049400]|uniref:hypothetical protein n=1 Tax=Nonomuraea sp. NPDC049400 TaxID=3364352 RepID=UPI0037923052
MTLQADATAVHVRIANAAICITGPAATTDWARRYYAPSWDVATLPADQAYDIPGVAARIDDDEYDALADRITRAPHRDVTYARKHMLLADLDGAITAVCPAERLAYRSHPEIGMLHITGCDSETLATAVARLAREMVRGQLIRDGWSLLHASAISRKDRVMLAFGGKGSGKTTTALTLTRAGAWELLANDRVFVRAEDDGRVRVLPWPSAAAVGLGLLDALGWYDIVRERLLAGEALHPTQDARVTDALLQGRRNPLWDGGRELKAQIWPVQFTDWFGVGMAQEGDAAALLFPQVDAAADQPRLTQSARILSDDDFMAKAEDRYPDIFQLVQAPIGGHDSSRARAATHLQALPHHGLTLTHGVEANAELLDALLKL